MSFCRVLKTHYGCAAGASRLAACLFFIVWSVSTSAVIANGWEHQAVPTAALLKALIGDDPAYRARAAMSIGIKQDKGAVNQLRLLIETGESSAEVRAEVYRALGRIADPGANGLLASALENDENPAARSQAAWALGEFADASTLDTVLNALKNERDPGVRLALTDALGKFNDPRAVAELLGLLGTSEPGAINALGRTRSAAVVAPLLKALSAAEDPAGQIEIVNALGMIGDPASRVSLEKLLASSGSNLVRTRIVLALGAIRDGSSVPALVGLLDVGTPEQKYLALSSLARVGDAGVAPVAASFYNDISSQIESIGRDDGPALLEPLLIGLRLQKAALLTLLETDPAAGVAAFLHAALKRVYPRDSAAGLRANQLAYESRRLGISGLGYAASGRAFAMLVSAPVWNDPDHRIRAVATRAVAVTGLEDAYPRIVDRLPDGAPEVRWTAASALGRLGNSAAVEPLRKLLTDPHSEVRRQALLSLGFLNAREVLDDIEIVAAADPSPRVRDTARQALELLQ